jgi:hypothetical protein
VGPELRTTAATSLTATAYSYSVINLAWQDNAANETGWEVHRSTTGPAGSFSLRSTTSANVTGTSDGALQATTEYCYKVRSFRTAGRRTTYGEFSNVACATTLPAPVPAAPSGLNAAPLYSYRINVTWLDNANDETGFRVERSATTEGPWTVDGSVGANATSYTDYVPEEQQFCYRVIAFNSFGDSPPSNTECTAVPAVPSGLAAAVSDGAVDLAWTDNSSVEDGFQVERSGGGLPAGVIATLPVNATAYHDATVAPNNTYWYSVRATRDGGWSSSSGSVQVVVATTIPTAPSGANTSPQSSTGVTVFWVDASTNEQGFRVERSSDGGATWTTAVTVPLDYTAAADGGLSPETSVCHRVIAFNDVGDSPPSNTDCTTPPAGPTGLTATGVDAETVDFAWSDNSGAEDGYEVWLISCDYYYGCYYAYSIGTLGPNATSFRYQDPYAYWYYYAVLAVKDGGYSDPSEWVSPTSPPEDPDDDGAEP